VIWDSIGLAMIAARRNPEPENGELAAGWGDKWASIKGGTHIFIAVLYVFQMLAFWYSDRLQEQRIERLYQVILFDVVKRHEVLNTQTKMIIDNQQKILNALTTQNIESQKFRQEFVYVMTISEQERRRLTLEVPQSIRERQTWREHP
jgi:hypothetical protein